MNLNVITADFVIIGAGIMGLSIALRLYEEHPTAKIIIIEKEKKVGLHASGRNSGVLHSGIYYPAGSLKAIHCKQGADMMLQYCNEYAIPINQIGKVIVPTSPNDLDALKQLYAQGIENGVMVEYIDESQLRKLEPATSSATSNAIYVPQTAVIDPLAVIQHLYKNLQAKGVVFYLDNCCRQIFTDMRLIKLDTIRINYKHLINTAGIYADKIAKSCGLPNKYTIMPFKGLYYELSPHLATKINHLIYPVPDLNMPFLGIHFTKTVSGKVYVGPTAIPALGREQYQGWMGLKIREVTNIVYHLLIQYKLNQQGFKSYAHREISRFLKYKFVSAAKLLLPAITSQDIVLSKKVGIRAQLLDLSNHQLVMDFLTHQTNNETHILNAVSPAFTSAFSFSEYVIGLINTKL